MNAYDAIAPVDKSDAAQVTAPLVQFLEALRLPAGHQASMTVTLDETSWRHLRRQFQRPYQKRPSREFSIYLPIGGGCQTVWFQVAEPEGQVDEPGGPSREQRVEGFVEQKCRTAAAMVNRDALYDHAIESLPTPRIVEATYGGVWTAPEEK